MHHQTNLIYLIRGAWISKNNAELPNIKTIPQGFIGYLSFTGQQ